MNAYERSYLRGRLSTPEGRAELRTDAAGRHAAIVMRRARRGEYKHMTLMEWHAELLSHSKTIDDFYDEGGWRMI